MARQQAKPNAFIRKTIAGKARAAREVECPVCGQSLLVGDNCDVAAWEVRIDADPVDPLAETIAVLQGKASYVVVRGGRYGPEIDYRDLSSVGTESRRPIHIEHSCQTDEMRRDG